MNKQLNMQSPVFFCSLDPNVFLSTLFSNTFGLFNIQCQQYTSIKPSIYTYCVSRNLPVCGILHVYVFSFVIVHIYVHAL
jgi:hypothetical protein